jgi:hypothetical protein
MQQSKFGDLYSTLSKKEKLAFFDFGKLAYFKLSENDYKGIEILKQFFVNENQPYSDDDFYQRLFKNNSTLRKKEFEYVKNHLLKVLVSFLKWQLAEDNLSDELSLLAYYEQKKCERNFESRVKVIEKSFKNKSKYYTDEFYQMQFSEILLENRESRTRENEEINDANVALDKFFIINKLRLYCKVLNECNLRNLDKPKSILKTLKAVGFKEDEAEEPLIILYYALVKMLENEQETETYHIMLRLLKKYEHQIDKEIVVELYAYLRNRCSYYCNTGIVDFSRHLLDLVKYLESKNMLLKSSAISLSLFKNSVSVAFINDDFDWATIFIEKYLPFIIKTERNGIKLFHQADLEYHKENLDKALDLLGRIERQGFNFKDHFYQISYNKLFIKIHLMKQIHVGLFSRIDAFAKYIYNQKKVSKQGKIASLEFVAVAKKIYKEQAINLSEHQEKLTVVDFQWLEKFVNQ